MINIYYIINFNLDIFKNSLLAMDLITMKIGVNIKVILTYGLFLKEILILINQPIPLKYL